MIQAGFKTITGRGAFTVPANVTIVEVTMPLDDFVTRKTWVQVKSGATYWLYAYRLIFDGKIMGAAVESETKTWISARNTPQAIDNNLPKEFTQVKIAWSQDIEDYEEADIDDTNVTEHKTVDNYFEVINDTNHLLINDEYFNLRFASKITVTAKVEEIIIGNGGAWSTVQKAVVNLHPSVVTALIRPHLNDVRFNCWIHKKKDRILTIAVDSREKRTCSFDVYFFGTSDNLTGKRIGLECYDAQGRLVYSSNNKYLKVVASLFGGIELNPRKQMMRSAPSYKHLFDMEANHQYAVGPAITPWSYWDWNPQGHTISILGYEYKNNAINITPFPHHRSSINDIDGPAAAMDKTLTFPSTYVVADVTGF